MKVRPIASRAPGGKTGSTPRKGETQWSNVRPRPRRRSRRAQSRSAQQQRASRRRRPRSAVAHARRPSAQALVRAQPRRAAARQPSAVVLARPPRRAHARAALARPPRRAHVRALARPQSAVALVRLAHARPLVRAARGRQLVRAAGNPQKKLLGRSQKRHHGLRPRSQRVRAAARRSAADRVRSAVLLRAYCRLSEWADRMARSRGPSRTITLREHVAARVLSLKAPREYSRGVFYWCQTC